MTLDLNAIKARVEAASEGPWEALPDNDRLTDKTRCRGIVGPVPEKPTEDWDEWERPNIVITDSGYYPPRMPDAEFIAHAREDIPALLQEIERLRAELDAAVVTFATECRTRLVAIDPVGLKTGSLYDWLTAKMEAR